MLTHIAGLIFSALMVGGLLANCGPAWAQAASSGNAPQIVRVPPNSAPPVPAGLKVACLVSATSTDNAPTCPVIKYQGVTTWAYSFVDNRVGFAMVSYDRNSAVVRNQSYDGARYVWAMVSNPYDQTVMVLGQAAVDKHVSTISVPWGDLGPAKPGN